MFKFLSKMFRRQVETAAVKEPEKRASVSSISHRRSSLFDGKNEYPIWAAQALDGAPALMFEGVLMNVVSWIVAMASEAEVRVIDRDTKEDAPEGQELLDFLSVGGHPSIFTSTSMFCYLMWGNSYWHLIRNGFLGMPSEILFLEPWKVIPVENLPPTDNIPGRELIPKLGWSYGKEKILSEDLLHFRNGVDVYDVYRGRSPIEAIIREVELDAKAAGYSLEVLDNLGYAGNILIPESQVSKTDSDLAAAKFSEMFGRGKRGKTFVPSIPLKHELIKADVFEGADMRELRNICEERVCSAFRIQPAVVGFGTGMEQVGMGTTMVASVRLSWRSGVVPPLTAIRRQCMKQLFPEFGLDSEKLELIFESSAVAALQEDPMERARRLSLAVGRGAWITQNEARMQEGLDKMEGAEYDKIPEIEPSPTAGGVVGSGGGSQ